MIDFPLQKEDMRSLVTHRPFTSVLGKVGPGSQMNVKLFSFGILPDVRY